VMGELPEVGADVGWPAGSSGTTATTDALEVGVSVGPVNSFESVPVNVLSRIISVEIVVIRREARSVVEHFSQRKRTTHPTTKLWRTKRSNAAAEGNCFGGEHCNRCASNAKKHCSPQKEHLVLHLKQLSVPPPFFFYTKSKKCH
jgi:hypothetical protein